MRRLVALSLLALQLTLVAPAFAVSAAPDGVSVPADCVGDETVGCGLIPPWGNGEMIFGLPEGASGPGLVLRPFPDNQRLWRLCLKGEFGPEWSLAPCDTLPTTGGLEDFTQICVGRNEMVNCLLGGNDDFIGPVHFVWDGKIDIDVLSEGVPYQYKLAYQTPTDCGDRYTICGLLPPWGNTIQVERIVPLDREQGFTLIKEAVPAAQNAHPWRLCTDPRLGAPLWSLDACQTLSDGAGLPPRHEMDQAMHQRHHGGIGDGLVILLLFGLGLITGLLARSLQAERPQAKKAGTAKRKRS